MYNFKKAVLISVSLIISLFTMAQNSKELTLQHLMPGGKNYSSIVPQNIKQLQFAGDRYIYVSGNNVIAGEPAGSETTLITKAEIDKMLCEANADSLKVLPQIAASEEDGCVILRFKHKNKAYKVNCDTKKIVSTYRFERGDKHAEYSASADAYISTTDKALYLHTSDGKRREVVKEKAKEVSLGSNYVHRNEFGIEKGIFWSPDGAAVAFYRMDESKVKDYPLVNISARQAQLMSIKYPMAGMNSHTVKVGVYNIKKGKTVYLKSGKTDERYFTNISWSPKGDKIYILEVNRGQDTCNLVCYNAKNGAKEGVLFTETSDKYTEPENPLIFISDTEFIYISRKDGYRHAYLYNTQGEEIRQITSGEWEILEATLSCDNKNLYILSTEESPLQRNLYSVNIETGERVRVTKDSGVHNVQISPSNKYYIDNYSNHNTPRVVKVGSFMADGKDKELLRAKNPFDKFDMPVVIENGTILADDGVTTLYYRMTRPAEVDSTKKLPAIVYVYGGPHSQQISDAFMWSYRGWDIYMAQKGYVVFTLDNRGSANRGLAFESATHRQLGVVELADQMKGVEFLKSLPYIDGNRLGVHGWSFGGFMTLNMMLNQSDVFKVGVAGGAVTDWKYYEIMYGERYMGTPQNNPEGYKNSDMNSLSGNLKGRLMLIHCDTDPVVVWQHTLRFLESSIDNGVYPDYFVYPGHGHNVIGSERVHLYEKITRYFDDFL
ncbi:MAG: DPP IV N-terminal domain-containing protein [Muribaculaceae bacterium]|nr:DPP IV N-terminal domain-containing protein [Muribaculaceae bacterium]